MAAYASGPEQTKPAEKAAAPEPEPASPGWDPLIVPASRSRPTAHNGRHALEAAIEQIPPAIQEALQTHLMGSFVRVRPIDARDQLFDTASAEGESTSDELELTDEDNSETD